MLKKEYSAFLITLLFCTAAQAQHIGRASKTVVQRPKTEVRLNVQENKAPQPKKISAEQVQAIISQEEEAPASMTPEQKSEIDIVVKKNLKTTVKHQNVRERKDFIDIITNGERVRERRAALAEGKDLKEAEKAGMRIKKPDIDPADTAQMEHYVYQKAGFKR